MSYLDDIYTQVLTYWEHSGDDGFGGSNFEAPVLLNVRYVERTDEIITFDGRELRSKAELWAQQDLVIGSQVMLGDQTATVSPLDVDAEVVKVFTKTPDLDGNEYIRKAML